MVTDLAPGGKPPGNQGDRAYRQAGHRASTLLHQGQQPSGEARAHLLHLPRVCLPATGGDQRQDRGAFHLVLARDQPRGAQGQNRPAPRTADPQANQPVAGRPGEVAEPHHRRVDELLRPVLPVGGLSAPAARQLLPEALGLEEVQAAADLQAVRSVVDRATRPRARPVRPLAVGPRVLTAGEKSRVTGDRHARIRGSRGLRLPPATRPGAIADARLWAIACARSADLTIVQRAARA
jgi:hypothetical protein